MNTNASSKRKWIGIAVIAVLVFAGAALASRKVQPKFWTLAKKPVAQATFQSPSEAAVALANAAKAGDQTALSRILGPDTISLVMSGDTESNKTAMDSFVIKYQQMSRWVDMTDGSRILYIGADNFSFPVPLAKNSAGRWYFDAVAGAQEVRARDIGRNELLAIDACYALANAQEIFHDSGPSSEYAQRVISNPGLQDGLYWPASATQASSPLADLDQLPKSSLVSHSPDGSVVLDGYTLRILTAQGNDAEDGAQNYLVDGKLTGGFAVLATPVKYGETGIMSFVISREGVVYERDFGPDTTKATAAIQAYNPDEDWSPVD